MVRSDGQDIGNLIWILFVFVMLIASALRKIFSRPEEPAPPPKPAPGQPKSQGDDFRRFLEEVLGVKVEPPPAPEPAPAPVAKPKKRKRQPAVAQAELFAAERVPRTAQPTDIFQSTMATRQSMAPGFSTTAAPPIKLDDLLPSAPLQRAIVLAEIIGPPLSLRRTPRLF